MQFASRFNEISDDCCGEFVVDFAEMVSAHDTASDVSEFGAESDDSSDFLDRIRQLFVDSIDRHCSTAACRRRLSRLDTTRDNFKKIYLTFGF